jgi:para-nitrobenzyl esterase
VRLLTGTNRDDTRIGLVPAGLIDLIDEPTLTTVVRAFGAPDAALERYRAARPGARLA